METINIDKVKFDKLVALINWADNSPNWFEAGDRFWERVSEQQWELIKECEPDTDRYEFSSMETGKDGKLFLNVYDCEVSDEVTFELVPVYVCPF